MSNPFENIDARLSNIETLLLDLKHSNREHLPQGDQLLTIKETAEILHLSVATIYGYVSRNEIPFSKRPNSKRLWFSKQDLTNWIKEGRKKTLSEIEGEANTYIKSSKKK